jgi:hypothetical protein
MMQNLPLLIATVAWGLVSFGWVLPLLMLPMSRIKREFTVSLVILGLISISIAWFTKQELHSVSSISLVSLLVLSAVIVRLLRRLDYYVEDILQELFILAVSSSAISVVTSIWYWGIAGNLSLELTRVVTAMIPVGYLVFSWLVARQKYCVWSLALYVVLVGIKWIIFPLWGVWAIVLVLLYSTLVGYVVNWMVSTTYAEKILAWNIEPAKVWGVLVFGAGLLVFLF